MKRDSLIQLGAVTAMAACLLVAAMMFPLINSQRRELQVSFDLAMGDQTEPKYVLAAAALGSFRGLAVDWLWYRSEKLKQAGKFFEANSLAQWITILQPRFPKVWSFQAWNMAYNISVQTHTPAERWSWVNRGIELLRQQGIPNNTNSIGLYRELGWIFFHKMGQYTDDMHWYYKRRMAQEWQEVLGAPTEGATTEQVLARFAPVARAADDYLDFSRLTFEAKQLLRDLADSHPSYAQRLSGIANANIVRAAAELDRLLAELQTNNRALAEQLAPVRASITEQQARASSDPLSLLYADNPEARAVAEQIQAAGLNLDRDALRRIGRLIILGRYYPTVAQVGEIIQQSPIFDEKDAALLNVLADNQNMPGLDALMPFLRARVLLNYYHMDPGVMYELMHLYGPIDWRHPAAHGIYWSYLGVRKAGQLVNQNRIDYINTDRQVIHGLQELMRYGRVMYDPLSDYVDLLPDTRFIPSYEKAVYGSTAATRQASVDYTSGTVENYEAGHENFLIQSIVFSYLYGDTEQAEHYWERVRELYGAKDFNLESGKYLMTLDDFVLAELSREMGQQSYTRTFIDSMIANGMRFGLANGRLDIFDNYLRIAQRAHENYQNAENKVVDSRTDQDRLRLRAFPEVVRESYVNFVANPALPLTLRQRIYMYTPVGLQQVVHAPIKARLEESLSAQGYDFAAVFPPPPGVTEQAPSRPAAGAGTGDGNGGQPAADIERR